MEESRPEMTAANDFYLLKCKRALPTDSSFVLLLIYVFKIIETDAVMHFILFT
jgi:hypothetical protein